MWTFVKHARNNSANDAAKREGRRLVYDYRVLRDGEHVAWLLRDSSSYWLADLHYEAIRRDRTEADRAVVPAVRARSQAAFLAVIEREAHKIPTVEQLNARRAERAERASKHREQEARDRELRPELYR